MDQKTGTNSILVFIFGFLAGVAVSSFIFISPLVGIFFFLIGIAVLVAEKVWNKIIRKEILLLFLVFLAFGFGVLRYSIKDFHESPPIDGQAPTGIVASEPEQRENTTRFVLRVDNGEKILVNTDLYSPVRYGNRVEVEGRLNEPGIINDGINRPFDYAAYLAKDDIYHTLSFASVKIISRGEGNPVKSALIAVKQGYVGKVREILPEPESGLLAAFTIAGKSALPQDVLDEFRRVGVIHVVVLSGLHVSIVMFSILWLFGLVFPRLGLGLRAAQISSLAALTLFVGMAGATASILRAALMALAAAGGKLFHRQYSPPRALLAAGFLLVLLNPKILVFDAGFHLSFIATAGIIYLFPLVNSLLSRLPLLMKWTYLRELIAITLSAQLAVGPYILWAMGQISVIAIIANILIVSVVPAAMVIGFFAVILSYFSSIIALPLVYLTHLMLSWILWVSSNLANLPLASLTVSSFPFWAICLIYLGMIILIKRFYNSPPHSAN